MLSVKYYLISPQQAYNILLALFCINCSTLDVPQVPMCAKKTKLIIKNFKFIMCISFMEILAQGSKLILWTRPRHLYYVSTVKQPIRYKGWGNTLIRGATLSRWLLQQAESFSASPLTW